MKMIIDGSRNLSAELAERIAAAFGLKKLETQFFQKLIEFNQTSSHSERDRIYRELQSFKRFSSLKKTDRVQFECFSSWYIMAVLEGLNTKWGQLSTAAMARSLKIAEKDVVHAIETLASVGLIEKKRGRWVRSNKAVSTPAELGSLNVKNYHLQMIEKAVEASDSLEGVDRALSTLTIGLSKKNFEKLKAKVFRYLNTLNIEFSDDPEAEKIYQLNIQLFPLMNIKE